MQKITNRNRSSSSVDKSGKFDSHLSSREIGKTIASDKFPNTIDDFWFMINPNIIINPFDFDSLENIYKTNTIGIVKHLQSSFIRSSYNDFEKGQNHKEQQNKYVVAKLGDPELSKDPYSMIDKNTKKNISRLNKGELVMIHPSFRHPIKVSFPPQILKK
jgi:hypothetical protein